MRRGHSLQKLGKWTFGITPRGAFAPGQEFIVLFAHLQYVSTDPLVVRRIEPRGLASHIRVAATGEFRLAAERVIYEQDGERFYQDIHLSVELRYGKAAASR